MAFWDLVIEITVKEKSKWQMRELSTKEQISNNDILDMKQSWMAYLEKRIGDLGYKIAREIYDKRIR